MKNNKGGISLIFLMLVMIPQHSHAGWTEDWFDSSAKTGSSSFSGQQRGFYSAGSFSGRLNMSSDPILTISPPRIKAGCGGIDMFLGGVAFLDEEYLVQKLQNIVQAAPAIAFDIAMKVMSKELSDTMKSMESMINKLNSLQMDDCAFSTALVDTTIDLVKEGPDRQLGVLNKQVGAMTTGFKNWYEGTEKEQTNDNKVTEDIKTLAQDCPVSVKNIFSPGLILENIAQEVSMSGYQDLIRGIVGDVELKSDPDDKMIIGIPKDGCDQQDNYSIDSFVNGDVNIMSVSLDCQPDQPGGLAVLVDTMLNSIANKMQQDTANYTARERTFIDTSPVPVYSLLRDSIEADNKEFTVSTLTAVISYAYAFYIVDNLFLTADKMFNESERIINHPGATGPVCEKVIFAQPMKEFAKLREKLRDLRDLARTSYLKRTNESIANIQFVQSFIANQDRLNKAKASATTSE